LKNDFCTLLPTRARCCGDKVSTSDLNPYSKTTPLYLFPPPLPHPIVYSNLVAANSQTFNLFLQVKVFPNNNTLKAELLKVILRFQRIKFVNPLFGYFGILDPTAGFHGFDYSLNRDYVGSLSHINLVFFTGIQD
jgi:hypothetical protein